MDEDSLIFECDLCQKSTKDRTSMKKHLDGHKNWQCINCSKIYKSKENLKHHLRCYFDSVHVTCHVCAKSVNKWKFNRHMESHNLKPTKTNHVEDKVYKCEICCLKFNKLNNKSTHVKRMHKSKSINGLDNFKCVECSSRFRTREELRLHSFEHDEGRRYFCDFENCDRYFRKIKLLTLHKKCHFAPEYKCSGNSNQSNCYKNLLK
jgi:hypothetical protein